MRIPLRISCARRSRSLERAQSLERRAVGEIVTGLPGAAALLRGLGITACGCAADTTLAEAVAARGLPLAEVVAALRDRVEAARGGAPEGTVELIDHLVARYHERHRADLPGLIALAAEVEHAGAGRDDAPRGLAELLDGLRASLEEHMLKEELRVFPLMRGGRDDLLAPSLALMREEHADNALFLLRAEQLTHGFRAPADGAAAWERLYADLARFAEDLVAHVFIEERSLFPRFEEAGQPTRRPQRS